MDALNALYSETMVQVSKPASVGRPRQFNDAQILAIRADERPMQDIAVEYRVTPATICAIKHYTIYEDVEGPRAFVAPMGARPKLQQSEFADIATSTESNKVLAAKYGITPTRVWQIRRKYKPQPPGGAVAVLDGKLVPRPRRRWTKREEEVALRMITEKRHPTQAEE